MSVYPETNILIEVVEGLAHHFGLRFDLEQPASLSSLSRALRHRIRALRLSNQQAYLRYLRQQFSEWNRLVEEVTVHETSFFRHAGQFRALSNVILPELIRRNARERKLRLWSAACATGEEPYSLAIALHQKLPADWQIEILATDLSLQALRVAEDATYEQRRLANIPSDLQSRYFEQIEKQFRLRPEIRSLVTFKQLNLTQPLPDQFRNLDVVFCENVLIYFEQPVVRRVIGQLRDTLRESGYLFLGYAESLYGMSEGFTAVSFGDAYVYRRVNMAAGRPASESETPRSTEYRHSFKHKTSTNGRPRRSTVEPTSAKGRRSSVYNTQPQVHSLKPKPEKLPVRPSTATIEALIECGNLAEATRLAEQWLADEPRSLPARFGLARLYAAQDRDSEAVDLLRQLLTYNSLHAPSYTLLGLLCYRRGETDEAIAQFQHTLYLEPQSPLAYFYLGNIYQQLGQLKEAVVAYRNAIRVAAHSVPSWDNNFTPELMIQVCQRSITRLEKHT